MGSLHNHLNSENFFSTCMSTLFHTDELVVSLLELLQPNVEFVIACVGVLLDRVPTASLGKGPAMLVGLLQGQSAFVIHCLERVDVSARLKPPTPPKLWRCCYRLWRCPS